MCNLVKETSIIVLSALLLLNCETAEDGDYVLGELDETMARADGVVGVIYDFRLGSGASVVPVLGQVVNYGARRVVVAARGFDDGLWWTHKKYDGRFDKWRTLAGGIKNDPVVMSNKDGRLEMFFQKKDDTLYHVYQQQNREWSRPISMGLKASSFEVAVNQDGRLEVFAINKSTHKLWHIWQVVPSGNWSNWEQLGNSPELSCFVMTSNSDGRLQVFGVTGSYYLWTTQQHVVNGSWRSWHVFNYTRLQAGSEPAVGVEKDSENYSLITLAVRTWDDRTVVYRQTWKNVDSFTTINTSNSCAGCYKELLFRKPEMSRHRNLLFTVGDDLLLRFNAQYSLYGNTWSNWRYFSDGKLGSENISAETMYIRKPNGGYYPAVMPFAIFPDGNIRTRWQIEPLPVIWGSWTLLNEHQNVRFVDVETITDRYGCITVFGITGDRLVKFNDQGATPSPYCRNPNDWKGWRWLDDRDTSVCNHQCDIEQSRRCMDGNWHSCEMRDGCRRWIRNPKLGCVTFPNTDFLK